MWVAFHLRLPGRLDVAITEDELVHLKERVEVRRAAAMEVRLLDRHEAQSF